MGETADRFANLSRQFTQRAAAVPAGAWVNPAPCEGWVARDIVAHLVEWMPAFLLANWGIAAPVVPSVEEDPVGAWLAVSDAINAGLADPQVATLARDSPAGRKTFEEAVAMFGLADVLVHTWDLARATGLDEQLDRDEVHRTVTELESIDPAMEQQMRQSGHYGARIAVPADADEQTRLIAFMGRQP